MATTETHEMRSGGGEDPPRRPLAAGRVILVLLVALAVGSLLNAKGMLKTANNQNLDSSRRGLSLLFARPLYDLSHFLHTDRPRAALQELLGRRGDDDIAGAAGPSPTTTTVPPPTTTTVPKPVVSTVDPLTIYIAGDSLAEVPGESLVDAGDATGVVHTLGSVDSRVSTGLTRPDVFDWPSHIAQEDRTLNPRAVVVAFGANDDQSIRAPNGNVYSFGSPNWVAEYSRRVGGLMDQILSEGRQVFWIGVPIVRDPARWARYQLLDTIFEQQADLRPGRALYVNTAPLFEDGAGHYQDYLPGAGGQLVHVRTADGIHFQRAGGDRIANAVIAAFRTAYTFR